MSASRRIVGLCALFAGLCAAAQAPASPSSDPERGHLVLWIVHAVPPQPKAPTQWNASSPPVQPGSAMPSQTAGSYGQTAGSFGTSAGSVGVSAGSYGTTPSALGYDAGAVGVSAGSYGVTPSTFGHNAGDVGVDVASYGHSVGSFGESLSTINDVVPRAHQTAENFYHHPPHDARWSNWLSAAQSALPALQIRVVDVREDELQAALQTTRDTTDAPDLLLGYPLPALWTRPNSGLLWSYGLSTLGSRLSVSQRELAPGERPLSTWQPQASILEAAPHPEEARTLVMWMLDGYNCLYCPPPPAPAPGSPAALAQQALGTLLLGGGLGDDADPEAAPFDDAAAQFEALGVPAPDRLTPYVDVLDSASNGRFAVVSMRAILSAPQAFGVVDALAVLRRDPQGRWHVLHITPSLSRPQIAESYTTLAPLAHSRAAERVAGVSLSAPLDGDVRPPQPDLSWDNHGGAALQVVEWQLKSGDRASISHLFFVPDAALHLRSRVTAQFASSPAAYRWRVWSIGRGGTVVLTPWRTLNITR